MGAVDLDRIEPGLARPSRGLPPGRHDPLDLINCELVRRRPLLRKGNGARATDCVGPRPLSAEKAFRPAWASCTPIATPSRRQKRTMRARGSIWSSDHKPRSPRLILPLRFDRGRLREHQAAAPQGARAIVDQMPVGRPAVVAGRVHAHRRHHDPVGQGRPADRKGRRRDVPSGESSASRVHALSRRRKGEAHPLQTA